MLPESSSEKKSEHGKPLANRKTAQKVHRLKAPQPKTAAAFWLSKVKKPAGSALFGVQIAYRGQRHRFPLETANREAAAEKARGIYLQLVAKGWEGALTAFKPNAVKREKPATIGAWAEAVKATAGLRLSTFTTYLQSLRQIAAEIENIGDQPALDESGKSVKDRKGRVILRSRFDYKAGGREAWTAKVDALPLSVLDAASVQRWKLRYIDKAGTAPDARRRAENSAATLLRCARSLFSPKARKFATKELVLPAPPPFSEVEMPKRGSTTYQSKIDAAKLIEAARVELQGEPFKIFTLGLLCGLRKREIDLLTWGQVDFHKALIRIERTEFFTPKSEDSVGEVDLDPELLALLRGWKAQAKGAFVIESSRPPRHEASRVNYRCEPHFDALYLWLRQQGITARKPLHELRKELGAILASRDGIFAAQSVLRHAQISTTAAYYTDKKRRITAGLGSLLASPPQNTIAFDLYRTEHSMQEARSA
jgi:integrase